MCSNRAWVLFGDAGRKIYYCDNDCDWYTREAMELSPQSTDVEESGLTRRQLVGAALGLGAGALLASCHAENTPPQPELADCGETPVHIEYTALTSEGTNVATQEWHMPGLEKIGGRLHVSPLPITIMDTAGRDHATLPFWPDRRFDAESLHITNNVQLDSSSTKASLLFAAELPTTYDDFQFPGKGIRVTITETSGKLEMWDGVHKSPKTASFALAKEGLQKDIEITKEDGRLQIMVDGQLIQEVAGYVEKQSWIGVEATDGDYIVDALQISSTDKTAKIADMTSLEVGSCGQGFRSLAAEGSCLIGTAVALTPLRENPKYAALVAGNFTAVTTENALKPQFIHPQENVFTPEEAERIIDFANRHGMQVHGHALLPNRSMPEWMRTLPTETTADKARVQQIMIEHITTIVKRFQTIQSFDVVNEALDGTAMRKDTVWYKAMGDAYINIAFAAAHKANPNALLIINDYSMDKAANDDETRFTILLNKLRTVRQENPRALVGIGFEGHVYQTPRDCMSPDDLRRRMKTLMQYGMVARVSEMDVTTHYNGSSHTTQEGLRVQAQQFGDIAKVCLESPNCVSFTMWGIGGKYVSTAGINGHGELTWGSNLPWDKNLAQRPLAYKALHDAFNMHHD